MKLTYEILLIITLISIVWRRFFTGASENLAKKYYFDNSKPQKFFFYLSLLFFLGMLSSSMIPILFGAERLTGISMIIHVSLSPFFTVSLAVAALLWAELMEFNWNDWEILIKRKARKELSKPSKTGHKIRFWAFLIMATAAIISILISMFPFFDTTTQELLLNLHKYSTLIMSTLLVWHLHILLIWEKN